MTEEKPDNQMEELQKQIQAMLRNLSTTNMQDISVHSNAEQDGAADSDASDDMRKKLQCIREFNLKPREIRDYLDRFVVQQIEAKKVLSVAICDHYNHVCQCIDTPSLREKNHAKQNIVLLGPSGVGKTYLMRCIARLIGVPFVKADATKFSETGYVGHDVEDLVRDLVKTSNGHVELAQYGIIYIDEIDKIASSSNLAGRDVSGRGVQINLLKLMEETEVSLQSQTDLIGQMEAVFHLQKTGKPPQRTINTRHILFIVSGVFGNLAEHIKRRIKSSSIGFSSTGDGDRENSEYLKSAQTSDFIEDGFEPEFIGRLPIRVSCNPLTAEDLEQILLMSEDNIMDQYRMDFSGYGIDFTITRKAVSKIANQAYKEQTGARGLMTVMERIFRNYKFELPSTAIKSFETTSAIVANPESELKKLLKKNHSSRKGVLKDEVADFVKRFQAEHGLELVFTDSAITELIGQSIDLDKTIRVLCEQKFRDFHHGLKLIANNSGRVSFVITREVVKSPDRELSRWIVDNFRESGRFSWLNK